jgi:type I restriction enzyme S subunit
MSDELPEGWATAPVSAVIEDLQAGFASGEKNVEGGVAHLRMNNIGLEGELVLDLIRTVPERLAKLRHDLQQGDVLVCTTNSGKLVGKTAYFDLPGRYTFSNHLTRLRPKRDVIDGRFLRWNLWLHWKRGLFDDKCKHWVNQSNLPKAALMEDELVVPPLAEQRRIVAKLEALLGKVDACQKRLATIPVLVERFRQSVLAAACSGRLTADWREATDSPEPASELLARLSKERERNAAPASGRHRVAPAPVDTDDLPDLPELWQWATLDQIVEEGRPIIYGIIKPGPHDPNGVPYVRVFEMKDGRVAPLVELKRAAPARASKFTRATLKAGDLLISKDGTIGRVAIVLPELEGGNITQHLVRASVHSFLNREFVTHAVRSQHSQNWLVGEKKGVALQGVNVEDFRRLPLPIPPLPEQREIVRRVNGLFALADQLEARLAKAQRQVDKLTPSLLARAFRGDLVPTEAELAIQEDRDYESTPALLERMRGDRASGGDEQPGKPARRTGCAD